MAAEGDAQGQQTGCEHRGRDPGSGRGCRARSAPARRSRPRSHGPSSPGCRPRWSARPCRCHRGGGAGRPREARHLSACTSRQRQRETCTRARSGPVRSCRRWLPHPISRLPQGPTAPSLRGHRPPPPCRGMMTLEARVCWAPHPLRQRGRVSLPGTRRGLAGLDIADKWRESGRPLRSWTARFGLRRHAQLSAVRALCGPTGGHHHARTAGRGGAAARAHPL